MKINVKKNRCPHKGYSSLDYILKSFNFPIVFIFFILLTSCLTVYAFNESLRESVNYKIIEFSNKPEVEKIELKVPAKSDRIYFDFNQDQLKPNQISLYNYYGNQYIELKKTPFGVSSYIDSEEFNNNLDLEFKTFTEGGIDLLITYVDSQYSPIDTTVFKYEYKKSTFYVYFIGGFLIFLDSIFLLFSFRWGVILKFLRGRNPKECNYRAKHL
ncbi:MAG: hypothetical protein LBM13_01745 [Candidatus Ancillula sp.]|jgi:hypothetical protein|nr:hypothetical protein [Candidatus Ancillula sp.]